MTAVRLCLSLRYKTMGIWDVKTCGLAEELTPSGTAACILPLFTYACCLMSFPYPLPKPVLHRVRSCASHFNLQYPLFSSRSFGSCLHLLPRLTAISNFCSVFPSITCFRRQSPPKMWPIELVSSLHFFVGLFVKLPLFSHERSKWPSPFISSATFHKAPSISHLLSEVSKTHHHTELWILFLGQDNL